MLIPGVDNSVVARAFPGGRTENEANLAKFQDKWEKLQEN